jgi:hypothetical protein
MRTRLKPRCARCGLPSFKAIVGVPLCGACAEIAWEQAIKDREN